VRDFVSSLLLIITFEQSCYFRLESCLHYNYDPMLIQLLLLNCYYWWYCCFYK